MVYLQKGTRGSKDELKHMPALGSHCLLSLSLSLCICFSRLTSVLLAFASIKSGRAAVEATQSGSCSPGQPDRPGAQHAFIHTVWFSFPVSVAVELLKRITATTTTAKIATKNNYDPLLTPSTPFHGTLPKRCNLWHIEPKSYARFIILIATPHLVQEILNTQSFAIHARLLNAIGSFLSLHLTVCTVPGVGRIDQLARELAQTVGGEVIVHDGHNIFAQQLVDFGLDVLSHE